MRRQPGAVVVHLDFERVGQKAQQDARVIGARVAQHVGERLLHHPKGRRVNVPQARRVRRVGVRVALAFDLERARELAATLGAPRQPLDGGDEALVVEELRPEVGDRLPCAVRDPVDELREVFEVGLDRRGVAGEALAGRRERDAQRRDALAELVVQLLGDASALGLAGAFEVLRELVQLLGARALFSSARRCPRLLRMSRRSACPKKTPTPAEKIR